MNKILLALAFAFICSTMFVAHAGAVSQDCVIELTDGSTVRLHSHERPIIHNQGSTIQIESESTNLNLNWSDIKDLYFEKATRSNIDSVEHSGEKNITFSNNMIDLNGFAAGHVGQIVNMSGVNMMSFKVNNDGAANVDISHLRGGIYIVAIDGTALKIIKNN